jgi:hypothetical protein
LKERRSRREALVSLRGVHRADIAERPLTRTPAIKVESP